MQSALVLTLTNLATIAKLGPFVRAWCSGLLKRYPFFLSMTALSFFVTVPLLIGRSDLYPKVWAAARWPATLLRSAAAIEAFWILAGHFRGIHNFARWLIAIILAVSAGAATSLGFFRVPWNDPLHDPLFVDQYTNLWLVVTALVSLVFFRQFPKIPIRPNAARHLVLLAFLFGSNFVGLSLGLESAGKWKYASSFVIVVGGILAFVAWALLMNRKGEDLPF